MAHGDSSRFVNPRSMIVVGGGAYGWAAAIRARELGVAVTLVDPRGDGDEERASGGITRILRVEYGAKRIYTDLTIRARERWREIEAVSGADIYRETGVLFLVPDGDAGEWERASLATTTAAGAGGEELTSDEIVRRFPAVRPDGIAWGIHNRLGGFLWANRATATLAMLGHVAGVHRLDGRVAASRADGVTLTDGTVLDADLVFLATGAWTAAQAPVDITPTRQLTVYLRGGPADVPVYADGAPFAMYGMPAHDGMGLKVGSHITGPPGDPDDPLQRTATAGELEAIRAYAQRRFGVRGADATVVRADVCFYAMTPTEDPIVGRLADGRFVCAGFSGHGFKFAPVIGAAAAEAALGREPTVDLACFAP